MDITCWTPISSSIILKVHRRYAVFLERLSLNGKMNISIINLFVIAFLFQVGMVMESWAGGDDHVGWKVLEESECFFSFSGRAWERGQIMAISKKSTWRG